MLNISLKAIVTEAEDRGFALENVNFSDIEVCVDCKKVLFADDEAYSSHTSKDTLCTECSVYCDACETYCMTEAEKTVHEGYSICPSCVKKEDGTWTEECAGCGETVLVSKMSDVKEMWICNKCEEGNTDAE